MQLMEVSKADYHGGGASAVASHLSKLFRDAGHATIHYNYWAGSAYSYNHRNIYGRNKTILRKANEGLKQLLSMPEFYAWEAPHLEQEVRDFNFQIAHFHDLTSAISPKTLERLSMLLPVVWTLHDCSSFTGGCLYPMGCMRYKENCGSCPQLGIWPLDTKFDSSRSGLAIKRQLHDTKRVWLVAPSQWLAGEAEKSGNVKSPIHVIPNGIDIETFNPETTISRESLGIPRDNIVFSFSSGNLDDERKNVAHTIEALRAIDNSKITLLLLGNVPSNIRGKLAGIHTVTPGYVADKSKLAGLLSLSDAFLFTSRAENHPLATLEAMASGTPVLGYATGGVQEQVENGISGALVPTDDLAGLVDILKSYTDRDRLLEMGRTAREIAVRRFSAELMRDRYLLFFQSLSQN